MKKGFTMIELIFVIVILGILASVAIPRLASTRADAEISSAIANLRTLESDIASYYTVKGAIETTTTFADVTNVKVKETTKAVTAGSILQVGKVDCINVKFVERTTNADGTIKTPAYLAVTKAADTATGVCKQVQEAKPIKDILTAEIGKEGDTKVTGGILIGSSTSVYDTLKAVENGENK